MELSIDDSKSYKPDKEFVNEAKESLLDHNLTQNTELWLLSLPPLSKDLLSDINGQELSLKLHENGTVASFEGASGKAYGFVSLASMEPEETVFISSATDVKVAGKISRRVSIVHYPDAEELKKISKTDAKQAYNSMAETTPYFPMKSNVRNSRASASKSSRLKSSLSELAEKSEVNKSNGRPVRGLSRGHSSGVSAVSSEHSHGGKSKKRKQTE
ncbi:mediator-associated protein 2 [Trifolium pratense]|uniref:mediator-associated protein 2 n=1 Tax=Trifolium pratense TaxID=57577 RepID=UPI001E690333|nr:mediator-associated protein 2 [Trifolium pratense]